MPPPGLEGPGAQLRAQLVGRDGQDRGRPVRPFLEVRPALPEAPQGIDQAHAQVGVAGLDGEGDGRAHVVVIVLDAVQPDGAVLGRQMGHGGLGVVGEVLGVPSPDRKGLPVGLQPLEGERADRLQHHEPRVGVLGVLAQEALVDEARQAVEHVEGGAPARLRPADGLGGLELEAAHEHGDRGEEALDGRVQEVVAPGDRAAQRLLPRRQVARAATQQVEPALQPLQDALRREDLDAGRGQLDGQRQAVQGSHEPGHRRRVGLGQAEVRPGRPGPLHEEGHAVDLGQGLQGRQVGRVGDAQGRHRVLLLAVDVERGPRGDDAGQARRRPQEVAQEGRRAGDLLHVVEHEEHGAGAQVVAQAILHRRAAHVLHAHGHGDRRRHEGRIADRLQGHEVQAVGEAFRDVRGQLQREARLARAARPRQRQQAGAVEQPVGLRQHRLAPDEVGQHDRQVVGRGVKGAQRRELVGHAADHELADALRP